MLSSKCVWKSYIYYMYKKGLASNDLQLLICNKTKPNFAKGMSRKVNIIV